MDIELFHSALYDVCISSIIISMSQPSIYPFISSLIPLSLSLSHLQISPTLFLSLSISLSLSLLICNPSCCERQSFGGGGGVLEKRKEEGVNVLRTEGERGPFT